VPGLRRWRRCLYITAPIEIAASAAMPIKIGTSGEEPPPPEVLEPAGFCWGALFTAGVLPAF
jgi:hypothetical protein